jgi:hypothetical protein
MGSLLHETVEKFTKSIKHGKLVNEIVHIWEIQKSIKTWEVVESIHSHLI